MSIHSETDCSGTECSREVSEDVVIGIPGVRLLMHRCLSSIFPSGNEPDVRVNCSGWFLHFFAARRHIVTQIHKSVSMALDPGDKLTETLLRHLEDLRRVAPVVGWDAPGTGTRADARQRTVSARRRTRLYLCLCARIHLRRCARCEDDARPLAARAPAHPRTRAHERRAAAHAARGTLATAPAAHTTRAHCHGKRARARQDLRRWRCCCVRNGMQGVT